MKNSARNCKLASSRNPPTRVFLIIEKSQLCCMQQLMIPTPEFPNPLPHSTNWAIGVPPAPVAVPLQPVAGSPGAQWEFGMPPNRGVGMNAAVLMNPGPPNAPPKRASMPPGVLIGIPDLQLPKELQSTGSTSSARPVAPAYPLHESFWPEATLEDELKPELNDSRRHSRR